MFLKPAILAALILNLTSLVHGQAGARPGAATPAAKAVGAEPEQAQAQAAGIRQLVGKHLTLYTDVPAAREVDELPTVFDLAVPQWAEYFHVEPARLRDYRLTGFLMRDKARFQTAGLLPPELPPFLNGFASGRRLWLYDQTDSYYRRELFLHEGTHAFMMLLLGGTGPPWYSEGLAELLGTHRWQDGKLTLRYLPRDKAEAPGWGRVKIVRDEVAGGRGMMPDKILAYGPTAHLRNEPYGWCWALATFLDTHPSYQEAFRGLYKSVLSPDLTERFRKQLQPQWPELSEDWQLFVMNMDYGYDVAAAAIVRQAARPLPDAGVEVQVAANRGWQSSGVRLENGVTYRLEARGRYQLMRTAEPWPCEPGGVTLHYFQGQPLGMLLGAVRDDAVPPARLTPLARPEPIGLQRDFAPASGGTLYLKINESAAHLAENSGQLTVHIRRLKP